jgi:hypothetical protein
MPCQKPLYRWVEQVVTAFPNLSHPQATVLGLYSFGIILAQRCGLNCVAIALAALMPAKYLTVRSRLQEFYQPAAAKSGTDRDQLDAAACFAPLLAWVLKGWPSTRLALALDATSLGDRFTVLAIGVVYRGNAIPVAWKVLPGNVARGWKPEWIALLRGFAGLVPPGWTVLVMTDRGLYARWFYQEIVALGWHPLMRITRLSKFRKAGSTSSAAVTTLVPVEGRRWQGRGLAFPKKPRRRLECTLLACWEPGHEAAWFVLTDLPPSQAEPLWYGMRGWIEHGFRLLKGGGWQWQATRMTDPERVDRLWLALAVATRYVLAVGGEAETASEAEPPVVDTTPPAAPLPPADRRPWPRPRPAPKRRPTGTKQRLVSIFRQGLAALIAVLASGHALPKPHWKPEPWLELQTAIPTSPDQPPTPIPKNPSL